MEVNKIMSADVLDIIFEGRNKEYGAYELRKTYNNRIRIAIGVMLLICLFAFLSSILGGGDDKNKNQIVVQDVQLEDIKKEEKPPEKPPPPPPPKPPPPKVELTKFTPPKIVKDEEVKEPPPPVEEIKNVATINQKGEDIELPTAPPVEQSTGVTEPKKDEEDYDKVFTKVENPAKFPGGLEAWRRYLERNLDINTPSNDNAAPGNYTVKVQFIVDKDGNISQVQAIDVPKACPSCGPEAVKVIKKGPKWEHAVQNGRAVIYQAIQLVTFQVAEE